MLFVVELIHNGWTNINCSVFESFLGMRTGVPVSISPPNLTLPHKAEQSGKVTVSNA